MGLIVYVEMGSNEGLERVLLHGPNMPSSLHPRINDSDDSDYC